MSDENGTGIEMRTPAEWCLIEGVEVLDPDGWRGTSGRPWTDLISLAEFKNRLIVSTMRRVNPTPSRAAGTASGRVEASVGMGLPPAPETLSKRLPGNETQDDNIPLEAIQSAHDKLQERWGPVSAVPILHSDLRAALEAAYPAIRQQVAEEIAAAIKAIEEYAKDITHDTGEVLIPRDVAASRAREIGGKA